MINKIWNCDFREMLINVPDNSIDMLLTDPPYGIDNEAAGTAQAKLRISRGSRTRPIAGDSEEEALKLLQDMCILMMRKLKDGAPVLVFCGGGRGTAFARTAQIVATYYDWDNMIIWNKRFRGLGNRYRSQYEQIVVANKSGSPRPWPTGRTDIANLIDDIPAIHNRSSMQHPNEKPEALLRRLIMLHTSPGAVVIDPFCGAGSTCVAAKSCGRDYIGFEIDRRWAGIAKDRCAVQSFTEITQDIPVVVGGRRLELDLAITAQEERNVNSQSSKSDAGRAPRGHLQATASEHPSR